VRFFVRQLQEEIWYNALSTECRIRSIITLNHVALPPNRGVAAAYRRALKTCTHATPLSAKALMLEDGPHLLCFL
jgi:hypothetical protein